MKYFIGGLISAVVSFIWYVLGLLTGYALFGSPDSKNRNHYNGPHPVDYSAFKNEREE